MLDRVLHLPMFVVTKIFYGFKKPFEVSQEVYSTNAISLSSDGVITCIWFKVNIDKKSIPTGNYVFKVNNRNTRTRCKFFQN